MSNCTSTRPELLIDMEWIQGADRLEWKLCFQKSLIGILTFLMLL